jgi:hypothetical protein
LKPSSPLDVNRWGIAPIERLAAFVISLLRRAIWLLPADHSLMPVVQEARRGALEDRDQIAAFRRAADIYWSEWASDDHVQALLRQVMPGSANPMAAKALKDALDYWPEGLRQWTRKQAPISPPGRPDEIVARLIGWLGVARAVSMVNENELANVSDRGEELRRLTKPLELLGIEPNSTAAFGQPDDKVMRRLLALEVYFTLTDRNADVKEEQMVDLVVVNADTDNSWTTTTKTAKEKLTGFKFNYFGAFYKKSWRVNDWIWGRVDAASRLTLALLNVERLWQLNVAAGDIENALRKAGWIGDLPNGARFELAEYDEQRRSGKRTITALPETAALFAELRHRDFIEGELANLNAAVEDDRENGAGTGGQGTEFAAMYRKTMSDQGQALPPWERKGRALRIFAEADICSEDFDPGTLLYQRTLSKFMRALFGVLTYASSDVGYGRILTAVPYFVPALEKPIMWTKRTINLVRTAVPARVRLRR